MFSSTSGDWHNNNKFSSCSVRNISHLLDTIADNRRKICFKATNGTFCGNKIVEIGEEWGEMNTTEESCCYPRRLSAADRSSGRTPPPRRPQDILWLEMGDRYYFYRYPKKYRYLSIPILCILMQPIPIPQKIPIFTFLDIALINDSVGLSQF